MSSFQSSQLFLLLTEVEQHGLKIANDQYNHLIILRFPQFEEVFPLSIRGEDRNIAMMPTIALSADRSPSLYMTYSDLDERKDGNALDSRILGVSIPVTTENYETFQMEEVFEHEYGTFLTEVDKDKNTKIIETIKAYIQNMVELLIEPLTDETTRLSTLDRMVADYVPFVRIVSNSARCKFKEVESSTQVNINLIWDGKEWAAQLQNDYHPLWNIMLCKTEFAGHLPFLFKLRNFTAPLEEAFQASYWEENINLTLPQEAKVFLSKLDLLMHSESCTA